jgi:ribose-phosphate pyrophosphokinase
MQGFFKCPVDNLHAEPLIARWIRHNVPNWREAVCVSKNAGGTKRVTSLADALKLNFGMVTTDRRRQHNLAGSTVLSPASTQTNRDTSDAGTEESLPPKEVQLGASKAVEVEIKDGNITSAPSTRLVSSLDGQMPSIVARRNVSGPSLSGGSPLSRAVTVPARLTMESADDEYTDERAREVIHGRLVHGHIVPDDYPSPTTSAMSNSMILNPGLEDDPMELSRASSFFATNPMENHALGGTHDAAPSSDEEDEPGRPGRKADATGEKMITLVGDVRGRTVFIVDDMIDKAGSWVAAAETVVKRGKATKVYCVATHGLFGGNSLEELEACECIDKIVVTNSFPLSRERAAACKKLVVLELAGLLSEAIRRNHYGESISALFQHASD